VKREEKRDLCLAAKPEHEAPGTYQSSDGRDIKGGEGKTK